MSEKAYRDLAARYHLSVEQVHELMKLLQEAVSAPTILRYRKDLAANLTWDDLDALRRECARLESLERERQRILHRLEQQGSLSEELKQKLHAASTMNELMDYYVPFRPRKRSRSRLALAQGLEPLARMVFEQEEPIPLMSAVAEPYVCPEKGLSEVGEVLDGTFHIVTDWIAEEKSHRDRQRTVLRERGTLAAKALPHQGPPRLRGEFRQYMDFEVALRDVRPHQMLSLMRGKRLKVLSYAVNAPLHEMRHAAAELYMKGGAEKFNQIDLRFLEMPSPPVGAELGELSGAEFLYWCIRHSLSNVLVPILTRQVERELREEAEHLAARIIKRNLRSELMARPLVGQRVLGVNPGYRTGCKLAALDENGTVLETAIVYPHMPRLEVQEAKAAIVELVQRHGLSAAAIGDGTAANETEQLFSEIIAESCPQLRYAVLSEKGALSYAGSSLAEKELPGLDRGLQVAVSLGRRLLDPLCELTRVELRELCPDLYLQEVDGTALEEALHSAAQECVAEVGLDLNTAPRTALKYVPGLDSSTALEVVNWRERRGAFSSRQQLREVPKVDERAWREAAGFVKVHNPDNPLDATRIHPDDYPVALAVLEQLEVSPRDLGKEETRQELARRRGEIKFADFEKRFGVHYLRLKDILDELADPWPDPRLKQEGPLLRQRRLTIRDVQPGQVLTGVVKKVVDFGAFVDVGVGEDGLVHISQLSDKFVQSPHDIVSVGDKVRVRVVEVDPERRRIALSMRSESASPRSRRPEREPRRRQEPSHRRPAPAAPPAESATTAAAVPVPQSTIGTQSRRVRKLASFQPHTASRREPGDDAPQPKSKPGTKRQKPKERPDSDSTGLLDLLKKLDFAAIEKRGEQRE